MKCLLISNIFEEEKSGGEVVRKNNYETLKNILKDNLDVFIFPIPSTLKNRLVNLLFGNGYGIGKNQEKKIIEKIEIGKIKIVFIDSSIHGGIAQKIKSKYPDIKIITFFHNCEIFYLKEKIKKEGLKNVIFFPKVYYNEKCAIKYSDRIICLNNRDKEDIKKQYKIEKKIEILPLYLKDKYVEREEIPKNEKIEMLFIGSNFFANREGIEWFIENVLVDIEGKLVVVGRGMEYLKEKYPPSKNLDIIGTVESVDKYYETSNVVIAPIFSGSGMKTKTIEAMMFGKSIVGTSEAFEGVDVDFDKIGGIAETKDMFIEKLKKIEKDIFVNEYSREQYLKKYSQNVIQKYMESILTN